MAIAIVAANVRPINPDPSNVIGDVAANAALTAGDLVYHDGTGWAVAVLTSDVTGQAQGVALAAAASGAKVPVLVFGRLTGWTGLTAGTAIYSSADGALAQASAAHAARVGFAISTTDIFFTGSVGDPYAS